MKKHIIVHGKVQGVGFRATVNRLVKDFGIKGKAINLDDGTVEVYLEGEPNLIDRTISALQTLFAISNIEDK
ncbi:Acylphosphatase [Candidatus Rubidus massiliensis]|nr:Acylphosphatase [Candidatus Rubidus massiliensis]